jgi:hypothetical protein
MPYATLSINYARVLELQNTQDLFIAAGTDTAQRDDLAVCPMTIASYYLYNRTIQDNTANFGLNIPEYLNYPGGFVTTEDKLNSKHSNLTVEKSLFVTLTSYFNAGMDMTNYDTGRTLSRLTNIRRLPAVSILRDKVREDEVLTVGDFKRYHYFRGMIMMWSGTYDNLKRYLPFWRLCAPPDAGESVVPGLAVPNLQGRFIMGGSYNNFITRDNFNPRREFDSSNPTKIGSIGGLNDVTLVKDNLEAHDHANYINFSGGYTDVWSTGEDEPAANNGGYDAGPVLTFIKSGGTLPTIRTVNHSGGASSIGNNTTGGPWSTVSGVTKTAHNSTTISFDEDPIVLTRVSQGQEDRGGDQDHENRPPFYAMAYIMYVGTPRP